MARLVDRLVRAEERSFPPYWLSQQIQDALRFDGHTYLRSNTTWGPKESIVQLGERSAYSDNGVGFAVVGRRVDLFSQVRFAFKRFGSGHKPMAADLTRTTALAPLDDPMDLLVAMEEEHAWAGNAFVVNSSTGLRSLTPWHCTIILGSDHAPDNPAVGWDATPIGLQYQPPGADPETFLWDEVVHYAPRRDPDARYRGMSYLRPVLVESSNTLAQNTFIRKFYANNATPNMAVVFPRETQKETVEAFRDVFLAKHAGVDRAFRTAFLGGGADLKMIGANLGDLASKEINADQFARICAAAGVPPIVVTIVPGLESASTYANYATALRSFADITLRPLWYRAALKLRKLVPAPAGTELWYDVSGVSAMQADALDDAEVMAKQAQTMRTLVDGGFEPKSVMAAVTTGDLTRLVHTDLVSVQLIPPGLAPASTGGGNGG